MKKYSEDKIEVRREVGREENSSTPYSLLLTPYSLLPTPNCPACGAEIGREFAKYCRVCGKFLPEDYQPLDTLRASHRLHGKAIVFEKRALDQSEKLFEINENAVAQMAWACCVYSMVPYIGIIFIPLTFLVGGAGVFASIQKPWLGGRQLSLVSISLSFIILAIQILLWWLLYIIPTLSRGF